MYLQTMYLQTMAPGVLLPNVTNRSLFPLFPTSLTLATPSQFHLSSTLTYSPSTSFPLLYSSFPYHSLNPHLVSHHEEQDEEDEDEDDEDEDEDDEDEQVIGDRLVFEDGIFEDPHLEQHFNPQHSSIPTPTQKTKINPNEKPRPIVEPQNLVPDEWGQVVEEINLTKKDRRRIAQKMEFGQRIVKKKRLTNVTVEEYLGARNQKLSELKPLVLDNPTEFPSQKEENDLNSSGDTITTRVEPKNPRWAVYGRGLDDVTEFFSSGNYQPPTDDKRQGRQKLFTREEKVLMNARIPKLAGVTSQKWLPLHTLAASGEFYSVNSLLKHNVDINAADQDGLIALHKAINGKKQAVINFLLRESADPFIRDKDGASLMHYAVRTSSTQTIKTLLLHNVDVNLQDNDGWTPLHLAVQSRRTDVVRLLLMKGADKTLKNQDGLTALGLCLYSGRDAKTCELVKLLKQLPRRR